MSFIDLLNAVRDKMKGQYTQRPQLSSSHEIDMDLDFVCWICINFFPFIDNHGVTGKDAISIEGWSSGEWKVYGLTRSTQFTSKQLSKQSKKAEKDETVEKNKLKNALSKGNEDTARIYASNAIRKKNESLNLLRLSSRVDSVASRVETAVTMRTVSNSMKSVVGGMDKAMSTMNLDLVRLRLRLLCLIAHTNARW